MSTNQSSSRRVNQNDTVQLDSPTLLSKLDQLESQMKLAFPPPKKPTNDNLSKSIKSPTNISKSEMKSEQLRTTTILSQSDLNENKENINEKSIKNDDKQAKNSKEELISPLDVQKIQLSTPNADAATIKKTNENPVVINEINQQSASISKITTSVNISPTSNTITVNATTTSSTLTASTSNKPLSAWKRTKILSKTLSSINVMKSRTVASTSSSTNVQTASNQQNLKIKDDNESQLKKSSSGNLIIDNSHHHLNSPLNQIKRRSQEEVSSGLNVNTPRLSSSLSSSCQTSIHNLNESTKVNPQAVIQAALNNLNQSTGTYHIPDNYNTTIINQLNKNYLKNIQKQKARSDWKSLKTKLIGLARKDSEEDASVEPNNSKAVDSQESTAGTANTSQRKLSNSNQADDGIICKKEDLFFLLRNSNLAKNKQRRSNKPSLADVVVQLQESKVKKSNAASTGQNKQDKAQVLTENSNKKPIGETNQSIQINENSSSKPMNSNNLPKSKQATTFSNEGRNGRVQFVISNNEQNASSSSTPANKIKSSLKKTSSTTSTSLIDKNLNRQTKSNTINNMNLNKKKVKIYETDQDGIRKALILQSKDRNNNENSLNEEDELNDRNRSKVDANDCIDEDENNKEEDETDYKVKWDNENVVDAGVLGDAIEAFLSSITTNKPASQPTEKKVSFKK